MGWLTLSNINNKNGMIESLSINITIILMTFAALCCWPSCNAVRLEDQLYEDLLYSHNKVARPVKNSTDILTIKFGASLIRIIDVDEKNQVLTTNVWLEMQWNDSKLTWDPALYNGLTKLHIPSDLIWTPDIVLYNNAAGDYDITIFTDALVYYDGLVVWKPPAIYKSFCAVRFILKLSFYSDQIDVMWFPYDAQECRMKFGTWTYTGFYVDMKQLPEECVTKKPVEDSESEVDYLGIGMDLSYFYQSAEWDLLKLESERHEVIYTSCCGPEKYVDITYYFALRRKTLFFTVNLIIPCFLISFLTTFVFYLSDHKITFAISILVTLTVFFLILIDIIPPTSLVIPMFGRYLMTTMILVTLSIIISVISVNFHFRSGNTHKMPNWARKLFLEYLPKLLLMERPMGPVSMSIEEKIVYGRAEEDRNNSISASSTGSRVEAPPPILWGVEESPWLTRKVESEEERQRRLHKQVILRVLQHVRFIADHFRELEDEEEIGNDWTYVAMVMDRLFLIIFSFLNIGTLLIILQAPTLYDTAEPMKIIPPTKPLGQDTLGKEYLNWNGNLPTVEKEKAVCATGQVKPLPDYGTNHANSFFIIYTSNHALWSIILSSLFHHFYFYNID